MKSFLDISGLGRFLTGLKRNATSPNSPVKVGMIGNNPIYEVMFYINNVTIPYNAQGMFLTQIIQLPAYLQNSSFLTVVPSKTLLTANIPKEVKFNTIATQTCVVANYIGEISLCIMNKSRLLGKAKVTTGSDTFTGASLNGYITFRYY